MDMPSSDKTAALGLNKWRGEDKPKREDFNTDNEMVDGAIGDIRKSLKAIGDGGAGAAAQVAEALQGHAANTGIHVSEQEKQEMLSGGFVSGTYNGDGQAMRDITLGFRPKLGIIHATTPSIYNGTLTLVYQDYFSETGESVGSEATNTGFTVFNITSGSQYQARLNEAGKTYMYTVWK